MSHIRDTLDVPSEYARDQAYAFGYRLAPTCLSPRTPSNWMDVSRLNDILRYVLRSLVQSEWSISFTCGDAGTLADEARVSRLMDHTVVPCLGDAAIENCYVA